MSLKFERKLPAILFAVFVAITAIGFAFYQNTVSIQEAVEMERQTQRIISVLDETQNLAVYRPRAAEFGRSPRAADKPAVSDR